MLMDQLHHRSDIFTAIRIIHCIQVEVQKLYFRIICIYCFRVLSSRHVSLHTLGHIISLDRASSFIESTLV
jgi:hypothetical protein